MNASTRHVAYAPRGPARLHWTPVSRTAYICALCVDTLRVREVAARSDPGAPASTTGTRSSSGGAACVGQKRSDVCVASSVRNSSSGQSSLQICVGIPTVDGVAKTVNIQVALFAWKNILEQRSQSAQKHTGQMVSGGARDASFRHVTFVRELHGTNKRSTRSRPWRSGRAHGA